MKNKPQINNLNKGIYNDIIKKSIKLSLIVKNSLKNVKI